MLTEATLKKIVHRGINTTTRDISLLDPVEMNLVHAAEKATVSSIFQRRIFFPLFTLELSLAASVKEHLPSSLTREQSSPVVKQSKPRIAGPHTHSEFKIFKQKDTKLNTVCTGANNAHSLGVLI